METPDLDYMASILCNVVCSVAVTERLEGKNTLFSLWRLPELKETNTSDLQALCW